MPGMRDIHLSHIVVEPSVGGEGSPQLGSRMPAIAFLGLGHMGSPMAHRLVAAGLDVVVWNRTRERTAPLAAAGARVADTPAGAADGASVVITMLADPAAVEVVLFGPDGVFSTLGAGSRLVEMSTIGPDAIRGTAARLPAGVGLVDAPVGGGVDRAAAGQLRVYAGGAPSDLDVVIPILEHLGSVVRCGGVGSGAAIKLVSNTALVAGMALLGEAITLADALAVPRELALEVLGGGALAGAVRRAQATGAFFTVELAAKDLGLAVDATTLPIASAALESVRDAATRHAKEEISVLANLD
jgi:3-hydroxyisobutyrate dehydrogenase-like beta-hydroxyacid dehydrogenase